jgi:hypothetical protein
MVKQNAHSVQNAKVNHPNDTSFRIKLEPCDTITNKIKITFLNEDKYVAMLLLQILEYARLYVCTNDNNELIVHCNNPTKMQYHYNILVQMLTDPQCTLFNNTFRVTHCGDKPWKQKISIYRQIVTSVPRKATNYLKIIFPDNNKSIRLEVEYLIWFSNPVKKFIFSQDFNNQYILLNDDNLGNIVFEYYRLLELLETRSYTFTVSFISKRQYRNDRGNNIV